MSEEQDNRHSPLSQAASAANAVKGAVKQEGPLPMLHEGHLPGHMV